MPVRASVASNPDYDVAAGDEPRLLPFAENQQYAINRPPVQVYAELSDVFSAYLERALYGRSPRRGCAG
ncbi:MAG: hypothetical protein U0452_09815 [Anaerolineae bacterium]